MQLYINTSSFVIIFPIPLWASAISRVASQWLPLSRRHKEQGHPGCCHTDAMPSFGGQTEKVTSQHFRNQQKLWFALNPRAELCGFASGFSPEMMSCHQPTQWHFFFISPPSGNWGLGCCWRGVPHYINSPGNPTTPISWKPKFYWRKTFRIQHTHTYTNGDDTESKQDPPQVRIYRLS